MAWSSQVAVDRQGIRWTGKGMRRPEVALRWVDLLSGEAALAVAMNASLSKTRQAATKPEAFTVKRTRKMSAR